MRLCELRRTGLSQDLICHFARRSFDCFSLPKFVLLDALKRDLERSANDASIPAGRLQELSTLFSSTKQSIWASNVLDGDRDSTIFHHIVKLDEADAILETIFAVDKKQKATVHSTARRLSLLRAACVEDKKGLTPLYSALKGHRQAVVSILLDLMGEMLAPAELEEDIKETRCIKCSDINFALEVYPRLTSTFLERR